MLISTGRARALATALLALAALATPAAAQQLTSFQSTFHLYDDADGSGDVSCGDEMQMGTFVSSHIGAFDLTNLTVTWPVPDGVTLLPEWTIVAHGPESECSIVSGLSPGDSHVIAFCPFLCRTGGDGTGGTCTQVGMTLGAHFRIDSPNAATELRSWAIATAQEIETTVTEDHVEPMTPCPAAPPPALTASLVDRGALDWDEDGAVDPGESIVYTLVVRNVGGQAADQVLVEVPPPQFTSLHRGAVTTTAGAVTIGNGLGDRTVEVVIPALATGESATIEFAVALDTPLSGVSQIEAQGAFSAANAAAGVTDDPDLPGSFDETVTPVDRDPDVAVSVSPMPPTAGAGERITWEVVVSNLGEERAGGVTLASAVPVHTAFDAAASDGRWSCAAPSAGATCSASLGGVVQGTTVAVPFVVRVVGQLPTTAFETAISVAASDNGANGPDLDPGNNTAQATAALVGEPELTLGKSGPALVRPGDRIDYTLTYGNTGTRGAAGVVLEETVPPRTTFVGASSSAGWSCANGAPAGTVCRLDVGSLGAGESGEARFAVRLASTVPAAIDTVVNTATVRDGAGTPPGTATSTTAIDAAPELVLTKSGPPAAEPGDVLVYVLTASNTGDRDATGVALREEVPALTSFVAAQSSPGWSCADGAGAGAACDLALGQLAAGGAPGEILFAVRLAPSIPAGVETVRNTAVLVGDGTPDDPGTVETPVDAAPELALAKIGPAVARPGDLLVYTLTYRNVGDQAATTVSLVDSVPELAVFEPAHSSAGWACLEPVGEPVVCSLQLGELAAGRDGEATFAVRLAGSVPAAVTSLVNTATLGAPGVPAVDASATSAVEAAPLLTLTKSGPPSVAPGELLIYSLSWANQGDRTAVDVVLEEVVPEHTTFSAGHSSPGWSCADGAAAGTACSLELGDVPGAAAGRSLFAVLVGAPPAGVSAIENTALLRDGTGSPPGEDTTTTPVDGAATLTLIKSGPVVARPGETIVYELAYANIGDRPAAGAELRETVPLHTTYSAAASSAGWSCADGAVAGTACTLAIGDLLPGASGGAAFGVVLADPVPPGVVQVTNTALLTEEGGSPPVDAKEVTPVDPGDGGGGPGPGGPPLVAWLIDTLIEDDGDGLVGAGDVIGYTLTVEALEPVADVVVRVPPDPATSLVVGSVTTTTGVVRVGDAAGDAVPEVGFGDLGAGGSATMTFEVRIVDPVPDGVEAIAAQADVLSGADAITVSDDPDTPAPLDPTATDLDTPAEAVVDIPTLDHVGLALLVLVIAVAAFFRLRHQPALG